MGIFDKELSNKRLNHNAKRIVAREMVEIKQRQIAKQKAAEHKALVKHQREEAKIKALDAKKRLEIKKVQSETRRQVANRELSKARAEKIEQGNRLIKARKNRVSSIFGLGDNPIAPKRKYVHHRYYKGKPGRKPWW